MSKHFSNQDSDILWNAYQQVMSHNDANPTNEKTFSSARIGNSAYSFGMAQHDVGASVDARQFLQQHGFNVADIIDLTRHSGLPQDRLHELNGKLATIPDHELQTFSRQQFTHNLNELEHLIDQVGHKKPVNAMAIRHDPALSIGLLDYKNQFGSFGPDLTAYLAGENYHSPSSGQNIQMDGPPALEDLRQFRLHTKHGIEHPHDSHRRIDNIEKNLGNVTYPPNHATPAHGESAISAKESHQQDKFDIPRGDPRELSAEEYNQRYSGLYKKPDHHTPHERPEHLKPLYGQVDKALEKEPMAQLSPEEQDNLKYYVVKQMHDQGAKKVDYLIINTETGVVIGQCDEFKDIKATVTEATKPPAEQKHDQPVYGQSQQQTHQQAQEQEVPSHKQVARAM